MRACRSKPITCRLYSSIRSLVGVTGRVERATDGRHEAQGPISKRIGLEQANRKADDWWMKQKNVRQIRRSGIWLDDQFKRIRNILEKSAVAGDKNQAAVKPELLREPAEQQLNLVAHKIGEEATRRKKVKKYREALEKISELRPSVDFFFDKVLVMAEEADVRRNRLALLGNLLKEFSTIADFSELGGEELKDGSRN